jgi:hypothetical protein
VLAASPPFELQALALRQMYHHYRGLCSDGDATSGGRSAREVRVEARLETWERWRIRLVAEGAVRHHHRAVGAVLPNWETWRDRGVLPLAYRMTQVLTGHGVFGEFFLYFTPWVHANVDTRVDLKGGFRTYVRDKNAACNGGVVTVCCV